LTPYKYHDIIKKTEDFMKTEKIIQNLALKHGVSTQEIRKEIQLALDEGMNSSDPAVKAYWDKIPKKHGKPDINEVIKFIARESRKNGR
jgi:hypothetical protein